MTTRKKIPENETNAVVLEQRFKEMIANSATRSEKTSWNRKMDNMVKLLADLRPIEERIIELYAQKLPIFDEIQKLRLVMVKECIHPYEYLILEQGYIICKFCERKLSIPNDRQKI